MDIDSVCIRVASPSDALALLKIYAPYVEDTAISFEYRVPEPAEFRERMEQTLRRYPYLVAADGDEIVGYAYLSALKSRPAYDHSAESTIYLSPAAQKNGVGRRLYEVLCDIAAAQNITNLYAGIAYPEQDDEYLTKNSAQFHSHMGFVPVGVFRDCAYKFGRWYSMVWAEKVIAEHTSPCRPIIPFPELSLEKLSSIGVRA